MPYFHHDEIDFHYQAIDRQHPQTLIALHGLAQHSDYWMKTGIAEALADYVNVVALDLRGHGKTPIPHEHPGIDINTMVEDVNALAEHLDLKQFHLMGHSTGGMIASRYAMSYGSEKDQRLHSLLLINGGPSTQFSNLPATANAVAINMMATSFETLPWNILLQGLKFTPGPLFAGMASSPNKETLYQTALELMRDSNGRHIGQFIRHFYQDKNPYTERLEKIAAPTLVVTAELDSIFTKMSQYFLDHIPNVEHAHHPEAGHMTAIECPEWLAEQVTGFMRRMVA